ncbi:hypothetical protein GQ53DRAFT_667151, partial [Thozetella sp. PMI_491]
PLAIQQLESAYQLLMPFIQRTLLNKLKQIYLIFSCAFPTLFPHRSADFNLPRKHKIKFIN